MKKVVFWGMMAALAVVVLLVGLALGDSVPPYEHDYGEITPENPEPGQQITVRWVYSKINRWCPGYVQRVIYDKDNALQCSYDAVPVAPRDQLLSTRADGSPDSLERSFNLCSKAMPGPARYRAYTCYYCNPLDRALDRPICKYTPNIDFTIARPAASQPRGPAGERGSQGSQGPQGEPGPQGPRGP